MSLLIEGIQETLLNWMASEDNLWSVWVGDRTTASELLNKDGSKPYTRQVAVSQEMMAYDPNINLSTEIFKTTWVPDLTLPHEPDANQKWWISKDDGVTKTQVSFVSKKAKAKRSHWNILLKNHAS